MGSNGSPFREDSLFFEKAALVWQVLQKPARKSIADVLQMMDPTMDKSEAKKHKMKVSRLAKRIDADKLLTALNAKSSCAETSSNELVTAGTISATPASPLHPVAPEGSYSFIFSFD